ncbi:hypothetical protein ACSLFT_28700 [Streptomyces sp. G6]|uniref:hypothetical protein n=1 Tax=Streptomyces sp. G6 TaxID=1178736 RepID=UPI003EDAA163
MGRMSPEQLAELADELGRINTAAPELVLAAARWYRNGHQQDAARAVGPIARNLLDAETELTTLRTVIARLIVDNDRGDDHSLSDLRHELRRAGIDLTHEYAAADDLARATESEAL